MNSKAGQALLRAAILTLLCGAMSVGLAQDGADDLQAGIEAFNRGDLPGAMTLYEVAAESGLPEAQVRLAFLLDYAEENDKAVHWYRAAADQSTRTSRERANCTRKLARPAMPGRYAS